DFSNGLGVEHWIALEGTGGPALYAIGSMGRSLPSIERGLMSYQAGHWSMVGQGPPSTIYTMNTLDVFDDGRGPAVYIGGGFSSFGGLPAHGIARFDGESWSVLGEGVHGGEVVSLAHLPTTRGPALFAIGGFSSAGAGSVIGSGQWIGCPNCYANCD